MKLKDLLHVQDNDYGDKFKLFKNGEKELLFEDYVEAKLNITPSVSIILPS